MAQVPGKKARATRARILDAAAVEFRRKGVAGTRLADVAMTAGIGTGSLYYHFKTREELVESLLSVHFHRLMTATQAALLEMPRAATPAARLKVAIAAHATTTFEAANLSAACTKLLGQASPTTLNTLTKQLRAYTELWQGLVKDALENSPDQALPEVHPTVAQMILMTALTASPDWIRPRKAVPPPGTIGSQIAVALVEGIATPSALRPYPSTDTRPSVPTAWYVKPGLADGAVRLLDAAAIAFRGLGYAETRVVDIVAEADMQVGSFYHFFESREQLLATFLETAWQRALQLLDAALTGLPAEATPLERLLAAVTAPLWAGADAGSYIAALMRIHTSVPDEARVDVHAHQRKYGHALDNLVAATVQSGVVRPELDPRVITALITGILYWIDVWYGRTIKISPEPLSAQINRIVLCGLTSQPPLAAGQSTVARGTSHRR